MAAPLTTNGATSESPAWHELEEAFDELGRLARSAVAPNDFYRALLDECLRALPAAGGAVWLRGGDGAMQLVAQVGWPGESLVRDQRSRRQHERLLLDASRQGTVVTIRPQDEPDHPAASGMLLLAPVIAHPLETDRRDAHRHTDHSPEAGACEESSHDPPATRAIVEILLRPDTSPAVCRGCEQFIKAVCELAADFHAFGDLRRLRSGTQDRDELLQLSRHAHRRLHLAETAYTVANEGRRLVGCDRLSVLEFRGGRCRLLATSGVSRAERRSGDARRLERLAELVCRTDEPAIYHDGQSDALPPVAEALEQHAEQSQARQIAAAPVRRLPEAADDRFDRSNRRRSARPGDSPLFVLVAELFDCRDGQFDRRRLIEVAQVTTTALYNALEFERLPLGWLLRPLGSAKQMVAAHLTRTALVVAAIAGAVAALVLVPADFYIEAPGTLQPVVRRDVFAPRSGLVEEVLVSHGADVAAGQPLVRLRDPSLELELKRVDGEIETVQRQLSAVRATRTNRAVRDTNPADAYRLSAEEREVEQRLANLRHELELLRSERHGLLVLSPIAGRVLTWNVDDRLLARPVERGEVLVTVADLTDQWQLELNVPDSRIGYVLAAQAELSPTLPVRFRLRSDDREQHLGRLAEVCQTADVPDSEGSAPAPTVLVKVALDSHSFANAAQQGLRPGISARAQIACGRRPLGYVWLHDIWNNLVGWLRF